MNKMNRKQAITVKIILAITITLAIIPTVSAQTQLPSIIWGYKWADIDGDGSWALNQH
jgi:hypothetical protein